MKFGITFPILHFQYKIGRQGQGPGEFIYPMSIAASQGKIAVRCQSAISFFDEDGTYVSRFKVFGRPTEIAYDHPYIWLLNPRHDSAHMIEQYTINGEFIRSFGEKYINLNSDFENDINVHYTIYSGLLFCYDDKILYINSHFGDVFEYSATNGELISRLNLWTDLGERGHHFNEVNTYSFIEHAKRSTEYDGYATRMMIEKGAITGRTIFLAGSKISRDMNTEFQLYEFQLDSFKKIGNYSLYYPGKIVRLDSLAGTNDLNSMYLILAVTDTERGSSLELFQLNR